MSSDATNIEKVKMTRREIMERIWRNEDALDKYTSQGKISDGTYIRHKEVYFHLKRLITWNTRLLACPEQEKMRLNEGMD